MYDRIAGVLPGQRGIGRSPGYQASGTCGADGKQFCKAPWPEAELGSVPRAPPYSTEIALPPPTDLKGKGNLTVCGNKCTGQSDCSATVAGYACDCAIPSPDDARQLGLDPVAPPSICLSLDAAVFGMASWLVGRDVRTSRGLGQRGFEYRCRCNATYTGSECCGSRDGIMYLR